MPAIQEAPEIGKHCRNHSCVHIFFLVCNLRTSCETTLFIHHLFALSSRKEREPNVNPAYLLDLVLEKSNNWVQGYLITQQKNAYRVFRTLLFPRPYSIKSI